MGETTQGQTEKWAKRPGGQNDSGRKGKWAKRLRGERESGRNYLDSIKSIELPLFAHGIGKTKHIKIRHVL